MRRSKTGKVQRLAFRGKKVIEVTPMKRRGGKLKKAGAARRV